MLQRSRGQDFPSRMSRVRIPSPRDPRALWQIDRSTLETGRRSGQAPGSTAAGWRRRASPRGGPGVPRTTPGAGSAGCPAGTGRNVEVRAEEVARVIAALRVGEARKGRRWIGGVEGGLAGAAEEVHVGPRPTPRREELSLEVGGPGLVARCLRQILIRRDERCVARR